MLRVAQWWVKPAIIFRMFSCVGLDCEIRALFFISQPRCFLGSHRSHRSHGFARLMLNLTDDSLLLCSFWLTQIPQISLIFLMVLNLTEVGRWVVERVGVLWVLRVLRFPKLTQIIFVESRWICVSLREQGCVKHLWDLASGVQNCGICEICVRHKGEAERNILWDLWDFGGIIFCCGQFGVTL